MALPVVNSALLVRDTFLIFAVIVSAYAAATDAVSGKWVGQSPNPIGKTEDIALSFTAVDAAFAGVLRTPGGEIKLANVHLRGRILTFDASRDLRGRSVVYHYEGTLSGDTLDFTVQNDDGSSFFRFTVHRQP